MDDQEKWCITTQQVYDWITLPLTIHRSVRLPYPQRRARDEVCGNFSELTEEFTTLWETDVENVSGTVTLSLVTGTLDDIILSINGGIVVTGNRQIFTKFFPSLSSIEIRSKSEAPVTAGRYCLELEYSLDMEEEGSNWSEDSITGDCYFSDQFGTPLDHDLIVNCDEVSHRKNITVTLRPGEKIDLQEITVRFDGFISFKFDEGNCLCVIPFCSIQKVLLCAPDGTRLNCKTLSADCFIQLVKKGNGEIHVDIELHLCQSIQVLKEVHIALNAKQCNPRRNEANHYSDKYKRKMWNQ